MRENIAANGLTLQQLLTKAEHISDIQLAELPTTDDLLTVIDAHLKTASFFVAYLDYRVIIGRYADKSFEFYQQTPGEQIVPKYLQKIRIFNTDEELLLWRSGQTLKGRFRKDGKGDNMHVVDAKQVLFGTTATDVSTENAKFTEISETRGTKLILPFSEITVDDHKQRIFLKTRNYVDYTSVHQATYTDCRFVGFSDGTIDLI